MLFIINQQYCHRILLLFHFRDSEIFSCLKGLDRHVLCSEMQIGREQFALTPCTCIVFLPDDECQQEF